MTYVKSDIDGQYYLVRNVTDKQYACNILARIKENIIKLSDYLSHHKSDPNLSKYVEYIDLLASKVRNIVIIESTQDSMYTSYSVNKGEQIVFCLRTKRSFGGLNDLHELNLIMYVVLHEISHVACPIYDNHGPLFKEIFAFITLYAIKMGIYKKIDFANSSVEYCGLMITDSII